MFGRVQCDFEGKIDFIRLMLREYRLGNSDWVFLGDDANDVNVAKLAPLSIGYRPHLDLMNVVTHAMENFY
jgi:phosphoserine phosphatase